MQTKTLILISSLLFASQVNAQNTPPEIFNQLQDLRSELQNLRLQTEVQQQQIEELKTSQIDLHQELYQLKNSNNQVANLSPTPSKQTEAGSDSIIPTPSNNLPANSAQEKSYYDVAFELVKKHDFAQAKAALQGFIQRFPNGIYISHAQYWLGEVHLAENENMEALAIFNTFAQTYPNSPKIPDALYKLADIHRKLGNLGQAHAIWQQVMQQYPTSSAAKLAERDLIRFQ